MAFHQIYEPTGQRIKYEKSVPGIGPVDVEKIIKGFEYEKGAYVLLNDKEIEGVKLESEKTLKLTQFVDSHEIDPIYCDKPYYVVPADTSPRRRSSCCARRSSAATRSAWGNWRCEGVNM